MRGRSSIFHSGASAKVVIVQSRDDELRRRRSELRDDSGPEEKYAVAIGGCIHIYNTYYSQQASQPAAVA